MDSIMYTYYTLESKNPWYKDNHYYYFAGKDDACNLLITDEPSKAVGFQNEKDAKKYLEKRPYLSESFTVQKMISNVEPHIEKEFKR